MTGSNMGEGRPTLRGRATRWTAAAAVAALTMAACGGSGSTERLEGTEETPDSTQAAAAQAAESETTTVEAGETAPTEPEAQAESAGQRLEVSGGSTDPWSADATCWWNPDNSAPASTLWLVESVENDEVEEEMTVLYVWPMSIEDDSEPSLIGTIIEPNGNLLVVIDADASSDGDTVTVLMDVHEGLKSAEDPADYTLTVTCNL